MNGETSGAPFRAAGAGIRRADGPDKVRGRYNYLADEVFVTTGALHAAVLFSPHAHARVLSLDAKRALALHRSVKVLSFNDAPGARYNSGEWFPGQGDHRDETILTGHVRHVGDRIALVLADDCRTAREARSLLDVEYELLPPLVEPLEAERQAGLLHEDGISSFPGRLEYGNVEATFAASAFASPGVRVAEDTIFTQKIHHAALETHAVLAVPRPEGVLDVYSPCQILFGVQHAVAQVVPLPLSKIRVVKVRMGGTFGGKQEVVFEPLCAWAAYRLGRPVFLDTTREETFVATRTRAAVAGKVATALDEDGKILARRFEVLFDAGAYLTGAKKVMMAMGKKTPRLYRIPALRYEARAVRTSTTPSGACRGYGSPQIHAITEIHTDLLCRRLGFDPVEFRRKNLVHPFDDDPSGAANLGNARILDCLERGLAAFGWEKRKEPSVSADGRFRRGAGFACCTHGNGYYKTIYHDFSEMSLRFMEDGSAALRAGVPEMGHGAVAVMGHIVSLTTGLPPEKISVLEGDSLYGHYDIGCQASRGIFVCGECARLTAEKAVALLREEAEKFWGSGARLEKGGIVVTAGGERVPLGELVRRVELAGRSIDVSVKYSPTHNPGSYGVHFVDLTVDVLTGRVRIEKYVAAHDVGRALDRAFVEGQIYGGVQMGLGMALCEDLAFDARGRPSAVNFDKYVMVNAPDMPDVEVLLVEEGEEGGPFGAKSVGEIAAVPTAPAVVNAINRALGTELTALPLTPAKLVAAAISSNRVQGLRPWRGVGRSPAVLYFKEVFS
ncbi:MAG: molybdopterin-dependent oxidoreductase [Synergistaceae bacterium]|jgi:xanthine dehydrogenase molybdenum-binding subunit|nr:molybdopterin-dependent oxidoreductase [Synergistaceae bacterium]